MTLHTLTGPATISNISANSTPGQAFVDGDTIQTDGWPLTVDIAATIGVNNTVGDVLSNSVYNPSDSAPRNGGKLTIADGITLTVLGGATFRNINIEGGAGSVLRFQTVLNEDITVNFGEGGEPNHNIVSTSTDPANPFTIRHAGNGTATPVFAMGYNFRGIVHFLGWGVDEQDIVLQLSGSASDPHTWNFQDCVFRTHGPMYFQNYSTVAEASQPVINVDRCNFSRTDESTGNVALKLDGHVDNITRSRTTTPIFRNITVQGQAVVRFVGEYDIDDWLLRDIRTGAASDTNAASMNRWGVLDQTGDAPIYAGMSVGYMRAAYGNPHAWQFRLLQASSIFRDIVFELSSTGSDAGDGFQTSAGNSLTDFPNDITITIENYILKSVDGGAGFGNIGLTLNADLTEGGGDLTHTPKIDLRNFVIDCNWGANGINADEVGPTPTGTLGDVMNGIFWSSRQDGGYAIQTFNDINPNTDIANGTVGHNARYGLSNGYEGNYTTPPGQNDLVGINPNFVDGTATIATWDGTLGGPGTTEHAIEELLKRGTTGYDDRYTISALVQYYKDSYTAQATAYQTASDIGGPIGVLGGGGGNAIIDVNGGNPIKHLQLAVIITLKEPVAAGEYTHVRFRDAGGRIQTLPLTYISPTQLSFDFLKGPLTLGGPIVEGMELLAA